MSTAHSRLTAQGQISVPARIRRKLGLRPGSVLEWEEHGDEVIVRKAGRHSSLEIHRLLFPDGPPRRRTVEELREGIRRKVRGRHARD